MKRKITITAVFLTLISGCASEQVKTFSALELKISDTAAELASGKDPGILDTQNLSDNGYYYILSKNGIIIYHPEKGLVGSDFSRFAFVRKILEEKNGCIISEAGAVSRIIIFREKENSEILCYTLPSGEISGSSGCGIHKED